MTQNKSLKKQRICFLTVQSMSEETLGRHRQSSAGQVLPGTVGQKELPVTGIEEEV